jgi:hypothetical protein
MISIKNLIFLNFENKKIQKIADKFKKKKDALSPDKKIKISSKIKIIINVNLFLELNFPKYIKIARNNGISLEI